MEASKMPRCGACNTEFDDPKELVGHIRNCKKAGILKPFVDEIIDTFKEEIKPRKLLKRRKKK